MKKVKLVLLLRHDIIISVSHLIHALSKRLLIKCECGCLHQGAAVEDVTAERIKQVLEDRGMQKITSMKWFPLKNEKYNYHTLIYKVNS